MPSLGFWMPASFTIEEISWKNIASTRRGAGALTIDLNKVHFFDPESGRRID